MFGHIVDRCLWAGILFLFLFLFLSLSSLHSQLPCLSLGLPVAAFCFVRLKIGNDLYCNGQHKRGCHCAQQRLSTVRLSTVRLSDCRVSVEYMECLFKTFTFLLFKSLSLGRLHGYGIAKFLICMPGLPAVIHLSCVFINLACIKSLVGSRQSLSSFFLLSLSLCLLPFSHPLSVSRYVAVTVRAAVAACWCCGFGCSHAIQSKKKPIQML